MKELPPGWVWTTLGEACQIVQGQSPPGSTYNSAGQGLPFFQGKADFGELHPTPRAWCTAPSKLAEPDDVLISIRAPVGPTNVAVQRCCIGRGLAALRMPGGTAQRYILHYIRYSQQELAGKASGSTFGSITGAQLASHRLPVAPLAEQRRIVAEIEKHFTNIDPSCVALEASTKKLDKLISASIIRACLLSNPDEIRLRPVGSVGDVSLGRQRAPKHHYGPDMRPYLRVANVHEDRIETHDIKSMNFTDVEFERYRLEDGDVLLNEGQSLELVGRPAIYRGEIPECCFQNTLVRFKASEDVIPKYALYVFRAWLRGGEFRQIARWTTTMAHLGAERFAAMPFPVRPKTSQQRIVEHLDASLSSIAHLSGEISKAAACATRLRQAILKKAFEGKLVPQDPNEEPASVLLERIRAARTKAPARHAPRKPEVRACEPARCPDLS